MTERSISVVKFGGSVLTDPQAFRRVAAFVADLLAREPNHQLVIVVSAEYGLTDALLACAQGISSPTLTPKRSICCGRLARRDPWHSWSSHCTPLV